MQFSTHLVMLLFEDAIIPSILLFVLVHFHWMYIYTISSFIYSTLPRSCHLYLPLCTCISSSAHAILICTSNHVYVHLATQRFSDWRVYSYRPSKGSCTALCPVLCKWQAVLNSYVKATSIQFCTHKNQWQYLKYYLKPSPCLHKASVCLIKVV